MRRGCVWVLVWGLAGCADGDVEDEQLRPPPPDAVVKLEPPILDARPRVDAQRLDLGQPDAPTPDARPDAPAADAADPDAVSDAAVDAADGALDGSPDQLVDPDGALDPDVATPPDAAGADGPSCPAEVCNGVDDDCDGQVDEGAACGQWVQESCALYAGWSDRDRNPLGVAQSWGPCPAVDRSEADRDVHCTGTRRDGRFARLRLGGDVGGDDSLGVALRCADGRDPALAEYVQSRCALFMGWADGNRGPDGLAAWGACPNAVVSNVGDLRCTSTGFDGNFRALDLDGDVDESDDLGFAWLCRDEEDPARAAALTGAVDVFVGWADNDRAPPDTTAVWGVCPGQPNGEIAGQRCVSTRGDARFHRLDLDGDVDDNDALGFALRAR